MMGRNDKPQKPLFYAFNLDELVPQDHLLRKIDGFLDLSDLREHLAPYYSHTGRPSVDPELMICMLIIGYCLGIRFERRLCETAPLLSWLFEQLLDAQFFPNMDRDGCSR